MNCAVVVAVLVLWLCVYGRACCGASIDALFRARCAAGCVDVKNKNECESKCSLTTETKPGECPSADELSRFERACISSCAQDRDCPFTDKCCAVPQAQCAGGRTCQHAVGLDRHPGLPGIPRDLVVSDARWPRSKVVRWAPGPLSGTHGNVLYVVQERRYLGDAARPELFGPWRARSRRRSPKVLLDLTPAYWYQVRVAAVNRNGTQGFCEPSAPFKLTGEPNRPEEPRNLTVVRPGWVSGKLYAELRWKRPFSDIPLDHYKVSWSHCFKADDLDDPNNYCKANSVIVKHKSVNYKSTNFILRNLEPESLYFIQVQAITVLYSLKKKLSSKNAVVFINTTHYKNATYNWKAQPQHVVTNLRKSRFHRTNTDSLETKVMWDSTAGRFLVKWTPSAECKTVANRPSYSAIAEAHHYDIDHLSFNCTYQVSVSPINSNKSAKITIKTPLCSEISSKLPCV